MPATAPPRPHSARGAGAVVAGLVTAVLLITSCSGDDPTPDAGPAGPATPTAGDVSDLPQLEEAWSRPGGALPELVTDDVVVLTSRARVRVVDTETGETRGTARTPEGTRICQVSPQVDDGRVGLLLSATGRDCTIVTALDTETGRFLWSRDLPREADYYQGLEVAVGEGVVVATAFCDEVHRYDARSGRPLGEVIAPRDRKCGNETASDGDTIAVLNDAETADTPDDYGTGFIPPSDAAGAFELYDVGTGRRLWRHDIDTTRGADLVSVVSSSPTVLTTSEDGHVTQRLWSRTGLPGPYVGLGPDDVDGATVLGRADGVLVLTYPSAGESGAFGSLVFGYDLRTGEELWSLSVTAYATLVGLPLVAVTRDGLVVGEDLGNATALLRYDLRTASPDSVETLGVVSGPTSALTPSTLVGADGTEQLALTVPEEGTAGTPEDLGFVPPPGPEWADEDVRPEDASLACQAVTDETLALAGLAWRDLPTPADCDWGEYYRPSYVRRNLRVDVTVLPPGIGTDGGSLSAADAAEEYAAGLPDRGPEIDAEQTLVVDGEPTRAWGAFRDREGDGFSGYPTRLTTQWRNVVVTVTVNQAVEIETLMPTTAPWGRQQDAAYAATADVLAGLGAEAELPEPGEPGELSDVTSVCEVLEDDATALVPDDRPLGQAPRDTDGRQSSCSWVGPDADLTVLATAVPGALDGTTADDRADEVASTLPAGDRPSTSVDGVPGAARWSRYGSEDGQYRSLTASTRVGNLVVWVDLTYSEGAPGREEVDAAVADLIRTVVRSNA